MACCSSKSNVDRRSRGSGVYVTFDVAVSIYLACKSKGITQSAIAQAANVDKGYISRVLNGHDSASRKVCATLKGLLDIDIETVKSK